MAFYDNILFKIPSRSSFNRSYSKNCSLQFDYLYPTFFDEVLPGDTLHLKQLSLCRFAPFLAPAYGKIKMYTHYFFVPNRIVWPEWEKFISGVQFHDSLGYRTTENVPQTNITNTGYKTVRGTNNYRGYDVVSGTGDPFCTRSLADFLGCPTIGQVDTCDLSVDDGSGNTQVEVSTINLLPFLAYAKIWNDFYRDSEISEDLDEYPNALYLFKNMPEFYKMFDSGGVFYNMRDHNNNIINSYSYVVQTNTLHLDIDPAYTLTANANFGLALWKKFIGSLFSLRKRAWKKDMFSTARQSVMLDEVPVVPVKFQNNNSNSGQTNVRLDPGDLWVNTAKSSGDDSVYANNSADSKNQNVRGWNLGFTIAQLRLANAITKYKERIVQGGTRYVEYLASTFGVIMSDKEAQRAQYLGGYQSDVYINEVTQNSASTTQSPLGDYAGHAVVADGSKDIYFASQDYGYVFGITSFVADPQYAQGLPRMLSHRDRYSYYDPAFAHLTEQPIQMQELWLQDMRTYSANVFKNIPVSNFSTFGYTGRYDEYRTRYNEVSGQFRNNLRQWTMQRHWKDFGDLTDFYVLDDGTSVNRLKVVPLYPWDITNTGEISVAEVMGHTDFDLDPSQLDPQNPLYVRINDKYVGNIQVLWPPLLGQEFIESDVSTEMLAVTDELDPLSDDYINCSFFNQVQSLRPVAQQNQQKI